MINFNRDMSRGRDRRDDRREDRQMYKATCDDCGRSCEVPFKPSGDKPIFCSNCFKRDNASEDRGGRGRDRGSRDRDGGRDRDRGGRDRDRGSRDTVTMHKAICADCGRNCEVPFKPTQDKPVYCSDCFSKNNGGGSRSSRPDQSSRPEQSSKKHDELNAKLDKILAILQKISPAKEEKVVKVKKVAPKEIKKDVKKIEKKVAPKKVAKTKKVAAPKVAKKKAAKKTK